MTFKPAPLLILTLTLGCGTASTPQSAPAPAQSAPAPDAAAPPAAPAAPPGLQHPTQEANAQLAKKVTEAIAGHANEPAATVFGFGFTASAPAGLP